MKNDGENKRTSISQVWLRKITAIALVGGVLIFPAMAQESAGGFYKGKTLTIGVGAAPGGGLDTFARLLSRHLSRHIPGSPNIAIANMPGAGGQIVARYLYNSAPRDGTFIATFFPSVLLAHMLKPDEKLFDPGKLHYVANARPEISVCIARRDGQVQSLNDLKTKELVLGATTPGSQVVDYPSIETLLLGVKFRLVSGYRGTRDIAAAIEKGEVQGICGISWSTIKVQYPGILKPDHFARVLLQEDLGGDSELNASGVPLMGSLATDPEVRAVLGLLYAQNVLARPYIAPPNVPADRLALLRQAFVALGSDKVAAAEASKMRLAIEPMTGADMQKFVETMFATPAPVVARLRNALGQKK